MSTSGRKIIGMLTPSSNTVIEPCASAMLGEALEREIGIPVHDSVSLTGWQCL